MVLLKHKNNPVTNVAGKAKIDLKYGNIRVWKERGWALYNIFQNTAVATPTYHNMKNGKNLSL